MRNASLASLVAVLSLGLLAAGCTADANEESARSTQDAILDDGSRTGGATPKCSIEGFEKATWPTVEPQTEQTTAFVKDRIAKAKGTFTTQDFGPYQRLSFSLRVKAAKEVDAKLTYFHTLPGGEVIPAQVLWEGKLPADFEQKIDQEVYYDGEKWGLGADAPRFGLNKGRYVFSCTSRGGSSSDSQSYTFTRSAM